MLKPSNTELILKSLRFLVKDRELELRAAAAKEHGRGFKTFAINHHQECCRLDTGLELAISELAIERMSHTDGARIEKDSK